MVKSSAPDVRPKQRWKIGVLVVVILVGLSAYAGWTFVSAIPDGMDLRARPHRFPGGVEKRLKDAEEARRNELRVRFEQGAAMLHIGQFEHAVTAFHRVLALNPALPEAHANMGFAYLGLRNYPAAQRFFETAIGLSPSQINARYGRALALFEQGAVKEAREEMQRFADLAPDTDRFRERARAWLRDTAKTAERKGS